MTGPGAGDGNDVLPVELRQNAEHRRPGQGRPTCCPASSRARETLPPEQCDWYTLPPKPGSPAAARKQQEFAEGAREFLKTARAKQLEDRIGQLTGIPDSEPPE